MNRVPFSNLFEIRNNILYVRQKVQLLYQGRMQSCDGGSALMGSAFHEGVEIRGCKGCYFDLVSTPDGAKIINIHFR